MGPKSSRRTLLQAEGWVPEEIGPLPQRDDPPCRSGTAQGKLREKLDQAQCGTRNFEKTDIWKEASAETKMQILFRMNSLKEGAM
jgi:hypothetical protein